MKNPLKNIISPVKSSINLAVILAAISAFIKIAALYVFVIIISKFLNGEANFTLLAVAAVFIFAELILRMISFSVSHKAAFRLELILRMQILEHLASVPYGEVLNLGAGRIKKIIVEDVKELHAYVADTTPTLGRLFAMPLASLLALLVFDYRLLFINAATFLIGVIILSFAFKDNAQYQKRYSDAQANINASIIEFIQAMPVVRIFNGAKASFKKYDDALREYRDSLFEWIEISSLYSRLGLAFLSPAVAYFILALFGSIFYLDGSLELANFAGAMLVGGGLSGCVTPLMLLRNFIIKSKAAADNILSLLAVEKLPVSDTPQIPTDTQVEFKNVSFKYPNKNYFALKEVSFKAKKSGVTAIVGSSGAGKSTVAALLARFYDVDDGEISIGSVNIKEIPQSVLSKTLSFVFQDAFLFNESIYENIIKANPNAPKERVMSVCKALGVDDFVQKMPNGYDTLANDRGINLSGGQRQRIAIARAILSEASILVFDEMTSFMDPKSEAQIIEALLNFIKDKVVIMVAHRLSVAQNADQILVFKDGRIAQIGDHAKLIVQDGEYKELWQSYERAKIWSFGGENEI